MDPLQRGDEPGRPRKIGSYRIEERLGSGGMGVVYRAFDEALQRPLAIKHLLADPAHPTASRRFRREAQAAARINHPAVVHIYDIVETGEGHWIAMELVEGTPLDRLIRDGSLDLPHAIRLAREIAEGLAEAHAHGIIHRDLKASNVMVTASGHAKILDFGLAKLVHAGDDQPDLSRPGIVLGTSHAMSPEQAQGLPLDHRSDLFSFGSLFYEMLTATSPFRGETIAATLSRLCSFQPPPVCRIQPEVPHELSDLVDRLLCKDPDLRPGSAAEVAALLEDFEAAVRVPGRSVQNPEERSTIIEGTAGRRSEAAAAPVSRASRPASSPHPSNERRQVTVVCCELVGRDGPTGSSRAFDPEFLYELMFRLRSLAEEVTRRYEGQLEGTLGGHQLLLCFGYPQVHEDNARRAVRAARELVDQVAHLAVDSDQGRPVALALRAGVHTGPAVVAVSPGQEPMTLGATLDLAVELQSLAEPGCVVVSPATRSLIARSFALETLPAVQVPGLAAPLIPHRVIKPLESPEDRSAVLLPMVGREPELELLLSRWSLAREGLGQAILINGEAGIGKSRLVRTLREHLEPDAVQWGACFGSPFAQSSPLQPVLGLLRQVLLQGEGPPLERLERSLRDVALLSALPLFAPLLDVPLDGRHPAPILSPERQREKTLEAIVTLVLAMAERQPLVLLIEDLHWLDPTTRLLVDHLIDQVSSAPLLLLMTLRLQTMESLWGSRAHLTQINLAPLGAPEAERLIEQVAGEQSLPAAMRRQIVARTDGVPLFLEELTKAVLESKESGAAQELPATLRDSLAARLDRLGTARQVAQVAAVIGRTFTFELLAAVGPLDEPALQQELRRLVQAELVYRKGFGAQARYLFKHALVQDAAYESLLRRERQQIHRRIAETLEARFPETAETTPEILAHHYTEAGLIGPAIDFWVRAGAVAGRRSASAEALDHLDRALRLLQSLPESPERDRRELPIQNARAAALMTGRGYLDPEIELAFARAEVLAERLAEVEERFWAVLGLQIYHVVSGNLPQGLVLSERLLQIAESDQRPHFLSIAWLSMGTYHFHHADYAQAVVELERAYELAPPDDHSFRLRTGTDTRVVALSFTSLSLGLLGDFDRAWHRAEQAMALARQLGCPFSLTFACCHSAGLAQGLRNAEAIRATAREGYDLAVELGFFRWIWVSTLLLAWVDLYAPSGGPPAVEPGDADSLQRVIAENGGCSMPFYLYLHAEILLLQGRPRDAWRALDESFRLVEEHGLTTWIEDLHLLRGRILSTETLEGLWEGDAPAEAERLFQEVLERTRSLGAKGVELRAALYLGKLWKSQGRTADARELVAQAIQGITGEHLSGEMRKARAFLESCS